MPRRAHHDFAAMLIGIGKVIDRRERRLEPARRVERILGHERDAAGAIGRELHALEERAPSSPMRYGMNMNTRYFRVIAKLCRYPGSRDSSTAVRTSAPSAPMRQINTPVAPKKSSEPKFQALPSRSCSGCAENGAATRSLRQVVGPRAASVSGSTS